jgi:hypothetical protein
MQLARALRLNVAQLDTKALLVQVICDTVKDRYSRVE